MIRRFFFTLLCCAATATSAAGATVTLLPGSAEQTTIAGVPTANPIRAQVTDASGAPVGGAPVYYLFNSNPYEHSTPPPEEMRCILDATYICFAVADAQGVASLPPVYFIRAGDYRILVRTGALSGWTGTSSEGQAQATVHVTASSRPAQLDVQNMWWAGPVENGWGMSVVKHQDRLFNVVFVYDDAGSPTWYVQSEGQWLVGPAATTFTGGMYSPRGAPWFAYDASRFVAGDPTGSLEVDFLTAGGGYLRGAFMKNRNLWLYANKRIEVQDFTGYSPSPLQGVADMWWGGPEQNGWGVAILEQFGGLFAVWFTYDAEGKPTWFVMPGGEWRDGKTYVGTIYRTSGSAWIGTAYDASKLKVGAVGPYTLKFLDTNRAVLEISVDGVARSLSITRQPF